MAMELVGFHSEWNLGSPGGWDYQRMSQELGSWLWGEVQRRTGLKFNIEFNHPVLNPVPAFADMLIDAHILRFGREPVMIALVAEEETLEDVIENQSFVTYLNSLDGVKAVLLAPHWLERRGDDITYKGERITVIFMDFNTDTLLRIHGQSDCSALFDAIRAGIVTNPRGMDPINAKGIFEAVTGDFSSLMSETTVTHTPWTRQFYPRKTTGPNGESIPDLAEWTRCNPQSLVLKPGHGYSGKGVFVGPMREKWDQDVDQALKQGDYIVQEFIPLELWSEESPWLDTESGRKTAILKTLQTDFRCFITHKGLIGFVGRFGGVPTNVGSGGGVQPIAILRSRHSVRDATERINQAMLDLGYDGLKEFRDKADEKAINMGLKYLLGPIMTALRPRLIRPGHLRALTTYCKNLWKDCITLEVLWQEGKLDHLIKLEHDLIEVARIQPWHGTPALIASDGLFNFGAGSAPR